MNSISGRVMTGSFEGLRSSGRRFLLPLSTWRRTHTLSNWTADVHASQCDAMPGTVFPRHQPRFTKSYAEIELWRALQRQLPDGWTAWHSLKLRVSGRWEGEGDFIIAVPERGFIVLEVKGGQLELRDGFWFQNGKRLAKSPRDQAHDVARNLAKAVSPGTKLPFIIACAFPDTEFSEGPTTGDLKELVLGKLQLRYLAETLSALADRELPPLRVPLSEGWRERLHAVWGETWVPHVQLADRVEELQQRYIALDEEQLRLLDFAGNNARAHVDGAAGTGKTIVARELCVRRARGGQRSLFLCFTDALAQAVQAQFEAAGVGEHVRAVPVRRYALELLALAGHHATPQQQGFWPEIGRVAVEKGAQVHAPPYALVVIDEAQDLEPADWAFIDVLSKDSQRWIFRDPRQRFWRDRRVPAELLEGSTHLELLQQQRSPPELTRFAALYAQKGGASGLAPILRDAPDEPLAPIRVLATGEGSVLERVRGELDALIAAGARPSDIAVLSLGGQLRGSLLKQETLGAHTLVRADSPHAGANVVADTFLRFKGLERPFVIVTELSEGRTRTYETRMHIALTRASVAAIVICTPGDLEEDARLASPLGAIAAA